MSNKKSSPKTRHKRHKCHPLSDRAGIFAVHYRSAAGLGEDLVFVGDLGMPRQEVLSVLLELVKQVE